MAAHKQSFVEAVCERVGVPTSSSLTTILDAFDRLADEASEARLTQSAGWSASSVRSAANSADADPLYTLAWGHERSAA